MFFSDPAAGTQNLPPLLLPSLGLILLLNLPNQPAYGAEWLPRSDSMSVEPVLRIQTRIPVNAHILPQHLYCPFCLFDFDAVGRIENFERDAPVVLDALGLEVR